MDYARGFFEASAILRPELVDVTRDELRLRNSNVITTLAADFRSLRGRTLLACILDEAAFLKDEQSRASDVEAARAVTPSLMTTGGCLWVVSSPFRRVGLLYQLHRDHFGRDDAEVVVVAGASELFNPTLSAQRLAAARAADPQAATSEWDGNFRSDLSQFLDDDLIDAAIDRDRPREIPPRSGIYYFCFLDAASGRHDAYTACIGHREGDQIVADVVYGHRPPYDPQIVSGEVAALAKYYRCREVVGDQYAPGFVEAAMRAAGLRYIPSELNRSELYLEGLSTFARGLIRFQIIRSCCASCVC
jgi:hypothetical protein